MTGPLRAMFSKADYPNITSGLSEADDAAVYRLNDSESFVFTTDFFTPVVDSPYDYGAIAAANSLSDVYAMGGEVILALNIAGFPAKLPDEIIREIFRGGGEVVKSAGAAIAGGHTIDSDEPLYGLAVLGKLETGRVLEKSGAKEGDILYLTKSLGAGIVTTAYKGDLTLPGHIEAASESMKLLNRTAARLAVDHRCHAATDITGFSFLGHALEIARNSNVSLNISLDSLPFLPGATEYAQQWLFPAGSNRNMSAFNRMVQFDAAVSDEMQRLLFTPETSGGLLLAIGERNASTFEQACRAVNQPIWKIGHVRAGPAAIFIRKHPSV